jgi:hypothetical protein
VSCLQPWVNRVQGRCSARGCAARWQAAEVRGNGRQGFLMSCGAPARAFDGDGHDCSGEAPRTVDRTTATSSDGKLSTARSGRERRA